MNLLRQTDESSRLDTLRGYEVLDTAAEPVFDELVALAARVCATPIALISLVGEARLWFKARRGLAIGEAPREGSFCDWAIRQADVVEVRDARRDLRFSAHALVTGSSRIRFYAGTPLISGDGYPLGTLCVMDRVPRELARESAETLAILGRQVVAQLEWRRASRALVLARRRNDRLWRKLWETRRAFSLALGALTTPIVVLDETGRIAVINAAWRRFARATCPALPGYGVGASYVDFCAAAAPSGSRVAEAVAVGVQTVLSRRGGEASLECPLRSSVGTQWVRLTMTRLDHVGPPRLLVVHDVPADGAGSAP